MWLWLIGAVLFFAIGMFALGYADVYENEKIILLWIGFFAAQLWPLVLALTVIFGPFLGLFWLGDRMRQQRLEKENSTKNK